MSKSRGQIDLASLVLALLAALQTIGSGSCPIPGFGK
jgi:hypothetical protein